MSKDFSVTVTVKSNTNFLGHSPGPGLWEDPEDYRLLGSLVILSCEA